MCKKSDYSWLATLVTVAKANSTSFFGGETESPICGLGQGSKAAPSSWVQLSLIFAGIFKQHGLGAFLEDPIVSYTQLGAFCGWYGSIHSRQETTIGSSSSCHRAKCHHFVVVIIGSSRRDDQDREKFLVYDRLCMQQWGVEIWTFSINNCSGRHDHIHPAMHGVWCR